MNRRRFLQYCVTLAAAAPLVSLIPVKPETAAELLTQPTVRQSWIPTQAEVDEWLEFTRAAAWSRHLKFMAVFNGLPGERCESLSDADLRAGEEAYEKLRAASQFMGGWHAEGYQAGREGFARENTGLTAPSAAGYSWYNGWAVGNADHEWRNGGRAKWMAARNA